MVRNIGVKFGRITMMMANKAIGWQPKPFGTIILCTPPTPPPYDKLSSSSSFIQLPKARIRTVVCALHSLRRVESAAVTTDGNAGFRILVLSFQNEDVDDVFADALKLKDGFPAIMLKDKFILSWLFVALLIMGSCYFPAFAVAEAFASNSSYSANAVSAYHPPYDPVSESEREASQLLSRRVAEAVNLLEKGRQAQAEGDYSGAVRCYSQIKEKAGDLAIAEYARVGHAISLYEVGDRAEAILEMEDMSITLKGYPEVHAALAAALYVDKNATISAERQFTLATLLDPRYLDLSFVKECKYWPPSLVLSLKKFLSLT